MSREPPARRVRPPIHQGATITPTAQILSALRFAAERHRGQRRKGADQRPYIEHPIDVATTLATVAGVDDSELLMAALLHDTVEDTSTTLDELEARFGRAVRDLVAEVTDDKTLGSDECKRLQIDHALRLSSRARLIRIADKLSNVRDVAYNPPLTWPLARRRAYFDWTARVIGALRGTHHALEAKYDEVLAEARGTLEALESRERQERAVAG